MGQKGDKAKERGRMKIELEERITRKGIQKARDDKKEK